MAAFETTQTLWNSLNNGLFDRVYENDTRPRRMLRSTLKHEASKGASVNCRLAQKLFLMVGRDFMGVNDDIVEMATKIVSDANDIKTEMEKAKLWWREPIMPRYDSRVDPQVWEDIMDQVKFKDPEEEKEDDEEEEEEEEE